MSDWSEQEPLPSCPAGLLRRWSGGLSLVPRRAEVAQGRQPRTGAEVVKPDQG